MIKFTILLRRNPALTHEQFVRYHRDHHANLPEVKQHVRCYVQCQICGEKVPGIPPTTFDGATESWFDDLAGLAGVFEARAYHGCHPPR